MAGYGDDTDFEAWMADNGYELPEGALEPAILRQRGSNYIDTLYGARFTGVPTDGVTQERAWPRTGATAFRTALDTDLIPLAVIQASYFAALQEANQPGSLAVVTSAASAVKREKVDVIETEYFAGSGDATADATLRLSSVEGLLAPFLIPASVNGPAIWAIGTPCP
jgi:hypothetical protein